MICRLRTFAPKGLRISRGRRAGCSSAWRSSSGSRFSRFWLLMILLDARLSRQPRPIALAAGAGGRAVAGRGLSHGDRGRHHLLPPLGAGLRRHLRRLHPRRPPPGGRARQRPDRLGARGRRRHRPVALPWYAPHLAGHRHRLFGEMLAKAQAPRSRRSGSTNVALRRMDARALDFPDASFDTVVAMHVISVVPEPERVVAEMARVCRPGRRGADPRPLPAREGRARLPRPPLRAARRPARLAPGLPDGAGALLRPARARRGAARARRSACSPACGCAGGRTLRVRWPGSSCRCIRWREHDEQSDDRETGEEAAGA